MRIGRSPVTTPALPDEPHTPSYRADMRVSPRRWRVAQTIIAIGLVGFAAWYLWRQWRDASAANLNITLRWGWLFAASAIVLAAYAFLIEIWRRVLARFNATVSFGDAARIWFVSNLGKYVPGKVWQVTTMAAMLNRLHVGVAAAGSAAAVITIANVVAGFGLLLLVGVPAMTVLSGDTHTGVLIATVALVVAMLAAPFGIRLLSRLAGRVLHRPIAFSLPLAASALSLAGCAVAWLLYGAAFELFTLSLLGQARAPWLSYVAAYTLSYLVGYLVLVVPGGIGPREAVLAAVLVALHMTTPAEAAAITIASRLWLTVLEIVPGLLYIVIPRRLGPPPSSAVDETINASP
jgi:uncharacterized membrane protein YbhN (UPF0104 family)